MHTSSNTEFYLSKPCNTIEYLTGLPDDLCSVLSFCQVNELKETTEKRLQSLCVYLFEVIEIDNLFWHRAIMSRTLRKYKTHHNGLQLAFQIMGDIS